MNKFYGNKVVSFNFLVGILVKIIVYKVLIFYVNEVFCIFDGMDVGVLNILVDGVIFFVY